MTQTAQGRSENGIVIGNTYDKYGSKNPIVKWMMRGFEDTLIDFIKLSGQTTIHEVGCGEGHWAIDLTEKGYQVKASDFSGDVIDIARANADRSGNGQIDFKVCSIYDLNKANDQAPLVMCCEVLEHLDDPKLALEILQGLAKPWLILSVPREPLWRCLNMMRGKYLANFGNTPGHIQNWSSREFTDLVSKYFEVIESRHPFPWTMLLLRTPAPA